MKKREDRDGIYGDIIGENSINDSGDI